MEAHLAALERHGPTGLDIKFLDDLQSRYSVGRSDKNELVIDGDDTISSAHAELHRGSASWIIEDLGSTNGTYVNGDRIVTKRALYDGDDIRIGRTTLKMIDRTARHDGTTRPIQPAPPRTAREHEVLVELCRPMMSGKMFNPPASVEAIAKALYVGAAAVRLHLGHLYDKFGILDDGEPRRVRLANEAVERGAVSWNDYR